jgi:ABC-type sugar transport system ATPase subunit
MQEPLVAFEQLQFSYGEHTFEFGDAAILPGQIVVMVGPSGAGKSTLMKLLRGELDPGEGRVYIDGKRVETRKKRLVLDDSKAGWVPQLDDLQSMLSLEDNIGHHILRMDDPEKQERIEELKRAMHLEAYSGQKTKTLSGGQRQRVSIAKAMAGKPPVLLMDESLAQLDLRTKSSILLDLKALVKQEQFCALLVLHDPADALLIADELWVVQSGRLVQRGQPKQIIEEPINQHIAGLFDYINVVPSDLNIDGPWHTEDDVKWLYSHDLPELGEEYEMDRMDSPGGSIIVYNFQGHRLLKK